MITETQSIVNFVPEILLRAEIIFQDTQEKSVKYNSPQ